MQTLRNDIEAIWRDYWKDHLFLRMLSARYPDGAAALRENMLAPGKRWRPILFCLACRAAGREPLPELAPAALALELAHNFILVHDDIIDKSAERRGMPTLAVRMNQLFEKHPAQGFQGSDAALVMGDLLYTQCIESLLKLDVPDEQKTAALSLFTQAACETAQGTLLEQQAAQTSIEALGLEQIEDIYALKTGCYTFGLPFRLAAVFADNGTWDHATCGLIARHAGVAYQLLNDLSAIRKWKSGGPTPDDIRDGRRTWALVHAGSQKDITRPETLLALEDAIQTHSEIAFSLTTVPALKICLQEMLKVQAKS